MMRRGEIWVARLNPNYGAEAGKTLPVVILTDNSLIHGGLPLITTVPLTTNLFPGLEPLRVAISARDRLLKDCFVMLEQVRALDRRRVGAGPLTALITRK
jgi:mRNA interferase MazF